MCIRIWMNHWSWVCLTAAENTRRVLLICEWQGIYGEARQLFVVFCFKKYIVWPLEVESYGKSAENAFAELRVEF